MSGDNSTEPDSAEPDSTEPDSTEPVSTEPASTEPASGGRTRGGPARFVRQTFAELAQVTWPDRGAAVRYTAVVLAFLSAVTAATLGVDALATVVSLDLFG